MTISRRHFGQLAAAVAVAASAAPAVAQTGPTIKWRLASSFPKSVDALWGASPSVAKLVREMSDGKFLIEPFAAGEIVPGLQVLDAVQNGTVECGHTYPGYYIGKNPALIFDGSLPFGMTVRQHNAWYLFGDGKKLMDEVYDGFGVVSLPMGNTGGQMFGWFRKEIKSPADFAGIKMRVAGFGGRVLAKLGVIPQQIAGGEIYPALEKGRSTPPSGSALTTTRSSASTRSPSSITCRACWSCAPTPICTSTRRRGRRCRPRTRRCCAPPAATR
jgi:TRAP-type mannitol/chloroaromatic compound transport system substrate-binding protein